MSLLLNNQIYNSENITICNIKPNITRTKIKLKGTHNSLSKLKQFEKPNCSICLENIDLINGLKIKECGHMFHGECIKEWIKLRNNCPLCRTIVRRQFDIYQNKYKGFYKSQKRIFINDNHLYIFKINNKIKKLNKENKNSNHNEKSKYDEHNKMMSLFNSNDENYVYHYLLSIIKVQFKGREMMIDIAIDRNTKKIIKINFKNSIDSQNCFKLINDSINKKRNVYNR